MNHFTDTQDTHLYAGDGSPPAKQHDLHYLEEMMDFFKFSHVDSSKYQGTVVFRVQMPDKTTCIRSIQIDPDSGVQVYNTIPPGARISCDCSCNSDVFRDIYYNT
uniref:Uncharacterized protein n=1 Tax=Lygus hesperus TaxID=30085 RepID=A0A146LPH4_LYGHE